MDNVEILKMLFALLVIITIKFAAIDNELFVNLLGAADYESAEDIIEEYFAKGYKQIKEAMDKVIIDF